MTKPTTKIRTDRQDATKPAASVPAVTQAVQVLRCLAEANREMTATAVARETGISPSSCFNLLRTLASEGFVRFDADSKTYSIGLGLLEIASPLLSQNQSGMIWPELRRMARAYSAFVALWQVGDDERMVLVDRVYADAPVRIEMRVGQRVPSFAGAIGRCVAAASRLPASRLRARFRKLIWHAPMSFEEYERQVEQAGKAGFSIDSGQYLGNISVVGTAIVDADGQPRMGIGALTLAGQLSPEELRALGETLHATAALVGRIWYPPRATA